MHGKGGKKRVCIIGSGPSVIVTAKYMLDEGCDVTIFDKNDRIGGTFASSYNGQLTISNFSSQFSDLPICEKDLIDDKKYYNDNDKIYLQRKYTKTQRIKFGTFLSFKEYCNYLYLIKFVLIEMLLMLIIILKKEGGL